jgi:hypothetical protein
MRRALLVALVLVAAACSDTSEVTESLPPPTAPPPSSTTIAPTTTTTVAPTTTTTTLPPATTVEPPADAAASYAITQIAFGAGAFIQITNTGNAPGDIGGHWLCQRPVYFEIPEVELGPGQSVWIAADGNDLVFVGDVVDVVDAAGGLGSLALGSGEMALYSSRDFADPAAIVDYVEWGTSGHGRSGVAVEAGIWPAGGFVETPEGTIAITAGEHGADDPAGWSPDIGV